MSISRFSITCSIGRRWTRTSNIERSIASGLSPATSSGSPAGPGRCTARASPAPRSATPRLSVVVVFATPPFWFASASTWRSAVPLLPRLAGRAEEAERGKEGFGTGVRAISLARLEVAVRRCGLTAQVRLRPAPTASADERGLSRSPSAPAPVEDLLDPPERCWSEPRRSSEGAPTSPSGGRLGVGRGGWG